MTFKPGATYRHLTFRDIEFVVNKVKWVSDAATALYGHWTMQRNHLLFMGDDHIIIKSKDLPDWREIPENRLVFPRK